MKILNVSSSNARIFDFKEEISSMQYHLIFVSCGKLIPVVTDGCINTVFLILKVESSVQNKRILIVHLAHCSKQ